MAAEVSTYATDMLLLMAPSGHTALLAPEASGGRVPQRSGCLLLVYEGQPIPMGCDRVYRVVRPIHDARRTAAWRAREEHARRFYTARGLCENDAVARNSARRDAHLALTEAERRDLLRVPGVMSHQYTVNDAIKLACWAEDLLVGSAIFAYDARDQEMVIPRDAEEA